MGERFSIMYSRMNKVIFCSNFYLLHFN